MTQLWAYVGDLGAGGELDWGGDWNGNIPKRRDGLPDLPGAAWRLVRDYCLAGRHKALQVDWGAYAARVNGQELMAFLAEAYGATAMAAPEPALAAYVALARELGEDGFVALVAAEL